MSSASDHASLRPVAGSDAQVRAALTAWLEDEDAAPLWVASSGSTGRPKQVALSRAAVLAAVAATHERLGGPGTWTLDLPVRYVAGLMVLARTILAGERPQRRYTSVVPTQLWRALRRPASSEQLAAYDAVLVGGGPLDPEVRAAAETAGIAVVQTYGMSETCGGCVYDGRPLDGVDIDLDSEGQVLLRGPMLFDGYVDDSARTAATVVDGWFHTADLGEFVGDRLRILGRADDMVISGGVKVPAQAVEAQLRRVVGGEVVVVGRPDPEWGEVVVAVTDRPVPWGELRDAVEPRTWAPRAAVVLGRLPLLPTGKIDRVRVREIVGEESE